MMRYTFLNAKEIKKIKELLEQQFGTSTLPDLAFLDNTKGKIYLITKDVQQLPLEKLKIDVMGMYFGELGENWLRLSIEAAQLLAPTARKNVVYLLLEQIESWLKGESVTLTTEQQTQVEDGQFCIVRTAHDVLGCGKRSTAQLHNYVSKSRKLKVLNA